jgi:SAM-dependent methyltransferase
MIEPLVTIILRAQNQEPALRRLRPVLEQQQLNGAIEILLLDNDSHDQTLALAYEAGWRYQRIPRGGFNYASALNQAVFLAQASYCVSLSPHCVPQSTTWLAELLAPLRQDNAIIATYGPQSPEQAAPGMFSNANSAFRRAAILRHPFNPVVKIYEDVLFALELADEERIDFVPTAVAKRVKQRLPLRQALRRWQCEGWAHFMITKQRGYALPELPNTTGSAGGLRKLVHVLGYRYAQLRRNLLAQLDSQHQARVMQALRTTAASTPDTPLDWTEEMQLKADWGFIRKNIADFIRDCHTHGHFASPILEIGASGQNDYLAEWYDMRTSNLATNLQGATIPLDMEDMAQIPADSIGTVLCSEVIEHVRHPDRAICEAFRVLQPSGTLIITTPYSIVIHNTADDGGFHGRNLTPQGLELLAQEAGFLIERLETRGRTETRRRLMPSNVFLVARKPDSRSPIADSR